MCFQNTKKFMFYSTLRVLYIEIATEKKEMDSDISRLDDVNVSQKSHH